MIIKTEKDLIKPYLKDASNYEGYADIVYIPETIAEIQEAFENCIRNKQKVTISGAGTGLTGGKVPEGGAIISMEKLNKVVDFDLNQKTIKVQPGITLIDLEKFLDDYNLFYPPNPTENNSTIGGNIATNASGSRTFKYGATRDFVLSLELILGDNEKVKLSRGEAIADGYFLKFKTNSGKLYSIEFNDIKMPYTKNASGYYLKKNMDAIDLFIGSEGSLAITTLAELKLLDKPDYVIGGVIFFNDIVSLSDFVVTIRDLSKINNQKHYSIINTIAARLIEYFDSRSLNLLKPFYPQIPESAIAAIWFEQEYIKDNEDLILNEWYKLIDNYTSLTQHTWIALSDNEHKKLAEFRHRLPLAVNDIISQKKLLKIGTDTAVPDDYLKDYILFINNLLTKSNIEYAIWGHIGNNHLHSNLFPASDNDMKNALNLYDIIIDYSLDKKGTVSAEHGIGKLKKKYFYRMFNAESIEIMRDIRRLFNPDNLLGTGNIFD